MNARNCMRTIEYNYHIHPTTWGPCVRNCGGDARGSGVCVHCATSDLAEIVGSEKAHEFSNSARRLREIKALITDECVDN